MISALLKFSSNVISFPPFHRPKFFYRCRSSTDHRHSLQMVSGHVVLQRVWRWTDAVQDWETRQGLWSNHTNSCAVRVHNGDPLKDLNVQRIHSIDLRHHPGCSRQEAHRTGGSRRSPIASAWRPWPTPPVPTCLLYFFLQTAPSTGQCFPVTPVSTTWVKWVFGLALHKQWHLCPLSHLTGVLTWLSWRHAHPQSHQQWPRSGCHEETGWFLSDHSLPRQRRGELEMSAGGRIVSLQMPVS